MESTLRNSECWYKNTCTDETCDHCLTYIQMKYQFDNCGLPKSKYMPIDLFIDGNNRIDADVFKQLSEIRKNIVEFVNSGKNLYICSKYTGNGKTSWAVKMLQTYFHHTAIGNYEHLKGMFISVADLLLRLKDFNNPLPKSFKDNLENVDLVIWDDIAITGISQYDYTQLYNIINNRIFAEKSNIFTSNQISAKGLDSVLGSRLTSRIWNTSQIIEFKSGDVR